MLRFKVVLGVRPLLDSARNNVRASYETGNK